jgi:hypothetical protein
VKSIAIVERYVAPEGLPVLPILGEGVAVKVIAEAIGSDSIAHTSPVISVLEFSRCESIESDLFLPVGELRRVAIDPNVERSGLERKWPIAMGVRECFTPWNMEIHVATDTTTNYPLKDKLVHIGT